jgi:hypothetical protein
MQVAHSLCMGKACCKFYSAQLAPLTRKTVETGKHVQVPCHHGRRRPTLHLGKVWSRRPCDRRRAWVVHTQCRASGQDSRRPTSARCPDSCLVRRVEPVQALATHQARSRCPCQYARLPCPFMRLVRCRPLSRNNMPRSGLDARRLGTRWPPAWAPHSQHWVHIAHVVSVLDLARPLQEIRRRSLSRRSVHGEKASVHGRAVIGSLSLKGDTAAWSKMR